MITEAIDEYLALNHRNKIAPLLKKVNSSGKKMYTSNTAYVHARKELMKMYIK